jgi:RNA polymerase sigma factor (sigma-70 family)
MSQPSLQLINGGQPADSRAALRDLYTKYGGTVYGRCQYLLGDRTKAEDAMQDVFAKALGHWHEFRSESSPLTWLIRIATHHCLNVLRAERAPWHKRFETETRARGEGHGGPQIVEDREAVRKLLGGLDVETQQAVIHYFVDEMTLEEVAAAIGRSIPTVRKRLSSVAALRNAAGLQATEGDA